MRKERYSQNFETLCFYSKVAKTLENYEIEENYNPVENDFHPNGDSGCILLDDDYLFNIRCNHLIWIDGYSETYGDAVLLMGNHKGFLIFTLIRNN